MPTSVEVTNIDVVAEGIEGDMMSNNKGINLLGVAVGAVRERIKASLCWVLKLSAAVIALSLCVRY